jgi:hypothetical protein
MEKTKSKRHVFKMLVMVIPIIFVVILIWLATVYIGKTYFESTASAGQVLLWILSGAVICIGYPIASRQIIRLRVAPKNITAAFEVRESPKFNKSDWLFFLSVHGVTIPVLIWIFSDLDHHVWIYNFFVDTFGRNYKGAPNFPIVLIFVFSTFFLLSLLYLLFVKIRYGTFDGPKDRAVKEAENFKQKQGIYFSFVASTSFTVMILYYLKMVLLV